MIDPSAKMIEVAKRKEGIQTMLATVDEFLDSKSAGDYKFLMVGCVHHFPDKLAVFRKTYEVIPTGGRCMILLYRFVEEEVPLFQAAVGKKLPGISITDIASLLTEARFAVTSDKIFKRFSCSKNEWYDRLRHRFISTLSFFNDKEIEEGIAELEKSVLKGKSVVEFDLQMDILTASKKA